MGVRLLLVCLFWTLGACDSGAPPAPAELYHLSPYSYEFTRDEERYRIDYYYTPAASLSHTELDRALRERYPAESIQGHPFRYFSIYLYRQTDILNTDFKGDNEALSGVYNEDLLAYARWNQGVLDVFYAIESGLVVFDLLANQKIAPPWEFD